MVAQMHPSRILTPPGFTIPDFPSLSSHWDRQVEYLKECDRPLTERFESTSVTLGHDDNDRKDSQPLGATHELGWDNESPLRSVQVDAFKISLLPITVGEYLSFWTEKGKCASLTPPSWNTDGPDVKIKTLYGYVPVEFGKQWPVLTSGKQLTEYAQWKGGRLPKESELRLFLNKYPTHRPGSNVGFENWHPTPPSLPFQDRDGSFQISNGGIFEWTSTVFDRYDGFVPSRLYPEYSVDFFHKEDQVDHLVLLGGSFATIPRLGGRKSFRNWYQSPYGMIFGGGRVVYEV